MIQKGWRLAVKHVFDRTAALVLIIVTAPVMVVVAIAVRFAMGAPVLFRQERPGFRGRRFTILKFRTMTAVTTATGSMLPDLQRLTRIGRFMRRTSLDELPQLFNVLRGELSLVGPRPLLVDYLDRYTSEQLRRHDVMPGITGWTQINGRNALSWDEKFALDLWYVDNWNLSLDWRILGRTIAHVFGGRGVSHPGEATMPEFRGNTGVKRS